MANEHDRQWVVSNHSTPTTPEELVARCMPQRLRERKEVKERDSLGVTRRAQNSRMIPLFHADILLECRTYAAHGEEVTSG